MEAVSLYGFEGVKDESKSPRLISATFKQVVDWQFNWLKGNEKSTRYLGDKTFELLGANRATLPPKR